MNEKWINKFQSFFPGKPVKTDRKGNIIVRNIDNSLVYINPLDADDLEKLRQQINDDNRTLFDELISELQEFPKKSPAHEIKHLHTISDLKRSSDDNRILFDNDLAFFTEKENENHNLLIEYLKTRRAALLCGYPATGKSIAVVDIADQLINQEYLTYYYSFKKKDRWAEVWEEILQNKDSNTVFVLDDIHLEPEDAADVLLRAENFDDLIVLFLSREVINANDSEQLNIYEELVDFTVKTEQPSIDEKAKGIIDKFQHYYRKKNGGQYSVENYDNIIKRSYRNLVVLREYLKYWESQPDTPLGKLDENQFYREIYYRYFKAQNIKNSWEAPFLQYLCLYYFEINFYPSPKYLTETDALAENANRIIDDGDGTYSIYHGEYAFLILKAYKAMNLSKFNREYNSWEDFFAKQITAYFQGFIEGNDYPENLLRIFNSIPRFTKEVQGGVENNMLIFNSLIENNEVREWLMEFCSDENDAKEIALFIISLTFNTPHLIKAFLQSLEKNGLIFKNELSARAYAYCFSKITRLFPDDLDWLEKYFQPHYDSVMEHSTVKNIFYSLYIIDLNDRDKAKAMLNRYSDLLIKKLENTQINEISKALNLSKKIDSAKTVLLYKEISHHDLKVALENARIHKIGKALNELQKIDSEKTEELYEKIPYDDLIEALEYSRINEIGNALNELKNIDPVKTKKLYEKISDDFLIEAAKNARIHEVGKALNELKNVDPTRTKDLYEEISNADLIKAVENARIHEIGNALNELKNVDPIKTEGLYEEISNDYLEKAVKNAQIHEMGKALNELKNVDPIKTRTLYRGISNNDLKEALEKARINEIGNVLNELANVDLTKTEKVYEKISNDYLKDALKNAQIYEVGKALNELKNLNIVKTRELYRGITNDKLIESVENARIYDIGKVLNELKNIDIEKTANLYKEMGNAFILEKIDKAKLNYGDLLTQTSIFPKLDPKLAKELLNQFPESTLFNWEKLETIEHFNILASSLQKAGFTEADEEFRKLIDFGWERRNFILNSYRLQNIGSFISLMSDFKKGWPAIIRKRLAHFERILLKESQKDYVAGFIATLHMHCPKEAIRKFEIYQRKYPDEKEVIAYTNYFIGKRLIENNTKEAYPFYLKAAFLFKEIEMTDVYTEINSVLKEMKYGR